MMVHTSNTSIASMTDDRWHYQYGAQQHQPYHDHRQQLYYQQQQQQQSIGIFPERSLNGEEWKVAVRGREIWKVSSKPLPQEPPMPPPRRSFGAQQQQQQPLFDYWHYDQVRQPLPTPPQPLPHQLQLPPAACGYYVDEAYETDQSSATGESLMSADAAIDPSSPPNTTTQEKKSKDSNVDNTQRRITVQSVNVEHKVWIKIDTTETGLSLASKIHNIATFQTRKILSITTTTGRTIPLDHRPVFGSWMDMDEFKDGEEWKVEWCELDRSFAYRFVSRLFR